MTDAPVKPWTEHRAGLMTEAASNRLSLTPHRRFPRTGEEHMVAYVSRGQGATSPLLASIVSRAIYQDLMHRHT